jgi:hypothetical protein
MAWTLEPIKRKDLALEGLKLLDGSGAWVSDWLDSSDVYTVRIAVFFLNSGTGTVQVEEAEFDDNASAGSSTPRVIRSQALTVTSSKGYAELYLTARFYRVNVSGGSSNNHVALTVRAV